MNEDLLKRCTPRSSGGWEIQYGDGVLRFEHRGTYRGGAWDTWDNEMHVQLRGVPLAYARELLEAAVSAARDAKIDLQPGPSRLKEGAEVLRERRDTYAPYRDAIGALADRLNYTVTESDWPNPPVLRGTDGRGLRLTAHQDHLAVVPIYPESDALPHLRYEPTDGPRTDLAIDTPGRWHGQLNRLLGAYHRAYAAAVRVRDNDRPRARRLGNAFVRLVTGIPVGPGCKARVYGPAALSVDIPSIADGVIWVRCAPDGPPYAEFEFDGLSIGVAERILPRLTNHRPTEYGHDIERTFSYRDVLQHSAGHPMALTL